jgi:hypothetical protein
MIMNYKYPFIICFILLISLNLSFTWPVDHAKITSSFGESRGDHFHDGIDIISSSRQIYPVRSGKLVFFWDKSVFPTENYPGGGNYKILKHDNYFSVYMHLEDYPVNKQADNPLFKSTYAGNETIGYIGDTGHSSGKHLHLSILHIDSKKSINPLIIFPKISDTHQPDIRDAYIRINDRYFRIRNNDKIRLTQHYPLLLDVSDSINKDQKSGPMVGIYELRAELNGVNVIDIDFSEIIFEKNGLTICGRLFEDLFDEKGYYKISKIEYIEGINNLYITASDFAGNSFSKKLSFLVDLDMQ